MKKKIVYLMIMVAVAVMSLPDMSVCYAADNGSDILMFYDFNEYVTDGLNGTPVDSKWTYWCNRTNFGSGIGEDAGTLQVSSGGTPALRFDDDIKSGTLHISFDAKTSTQSAKSYVYMFRSPNSFETADKTVYGRPLHINREPNKLSWMANVLAWDNYTFYGRDDFSTDQWHRYDLVRVSNGSKPVWKYYVDGNMINEDSASGESEQNTWCFIGIYVESGSIWLDNLRVERTMSSLSLGASLENDRVDRENGEITVKFTEPVDPTEFTKTNFTVTKVSSGERIENFNLKDVNSDSVTINFNGELESGAYNIALSDRIRGLVSDANMTKTLLFRTKPKTINIDGTDVIYPEIENIEFLNYDGAASDTDNMVTTATTKIRLKFNTVVNTDNIRDFITFTQDSENVEYTISQTTDNTGENEKSVVDLMLINMLKPSRKCVFELKPGIRSAIESTVVSENGEECSFMTDMDTIFKVYENSVDSESGKYSVKIVKNDKSEIKLTAMAAVYETIKDSETGTEYKKLIECKYFPIVIASDEILNVEKECDLTTDLTRNDISVSVYLIEYPNMVSFENN